MSICIHAKLHENSKNFTSLSTQHDMHRLPESNGQTADELEHLSFNWRKRFKITSRITSLVSYFIAQMHSTRHLTIFKLDKHGIEWIEFIFSHRLNFTTEKDPLPELLSTFLLLWIHNFQREASSSNVNLIRTSGTMASRKKHFTYLHLTWDDDAM
jgi:hypothetical protein